MSDARGRTRRFLIAAAVVAVPLLGCSLCVLAQPSHYRIARSRTIAAPAERIHPHLADTAALAAWEPWPSHGATPTITHSPTTDRVGSWVEWRTPEGTTRTTLTEIRPTRITLRTQIAPPGGPTSRQSFELVPRGAQTEVTFAIEGDNGLLQKALWPLANLEGRLSPDLDDALERLERAASAPP